MAADFMRPVVDIVDQLLSAGVNVTVYNGQLDLIVDTMGNTFRSCTDLRQTGNITQNWLLPEGFMWPSVRF